MKDILKTITEAAFLLQSPSRAFYSERAMQLKFGIELWDRLGIEPEMERRHPESGEYLDIFFTHGGVRYGIELKYKTASHPGFHYASQGAQDHGRYDFIYDVSRIEFFVASQFIDKGYSCLVTNDSAYWSSLRDTSYAKAFQLTDGTTLTGTYIPKWKHRTKPITLQRSYPVSWLASPRMMPGNASFKSLLIANDRDA